MTKTVITPLFIRLTVKALEDLHTGSGTGSGDIDAQVQRDRQGKPVIRASHFKGLLREAGKELIAFGTLTEDDLNNLLGTEGKGRGALRLTSLFTREDDAGKTLIWGSTQRVENKRQPKPDTLRFIEHVAAGTCFEATLRLTDAALLPLLEQLLNRLDRIGGNRNRGGGLIKLEWHRQSAPRSFQPSPLTNKGQNLCLLLRNLEPLCLPATGYPGNLICTHSFIRGQTLRGALMAWAIHTGRSDHLKLFEQIAVGDALPLAKDCNSAAQVLPIPLSILTDKPRGGDSQIPWWAGQSESPETLDSLCKQQDKDKEKPKRPGAHEYLCRTTNSKQWQRYTPQLQVRLRNATPERDSTTDPQLFSLEEIAENTYFQTELRCANQQVANQFLTVFAPLLIGEMANQDWLALGRGGQPVRIEAVRIAPSLSPQLRDDWTLTLTSDAIVRGERLGFVDNLSKEHLCQLAGMDCKNDWKIAADVVETETVHGFNAVTGLPRSPALALRRGSCWHIKGTGSAALAQALLKKEFLGERGNEGFGRFVIGLQPLGSDAFGKLPSQSEKPETNREEELLQQAQMLARQLEQIHKRAQQLNQNSPSPSQLQWLRSQATALQTTDQLDNLLADIKQAPERRPQGGAAWEHFPHQPLQTSLGNCGDLKEKRQLINYLVQWRVLTLKSAAAEVTQ
jgi:hypothetical protein